MARGPGAHRGPHRLAGPRRRPAPPPAGAEGAGAEGISADFTFATAEDQWQHDALAELTDDLVALRDPDGLVQDVERRLAFAESVEERTLTGERARSRWEACLASLSDPAVSPAYAGLELRPQLGLLPLGPDPESGLLEFAHVQTGDEPLRDPRTGALAFGPSSSLVFVLVPGGTALIGAQSEDPDAPAYDPLARDNEGPPREFSLAPYFISKYEMTQHQWSHFTGQNPSVYTVGEDFDQRTVTGANPVEQVSWEDCELILGRLGLRLPTEVQWEFAARGGTGTPWWNGARRDSIRGAANLADQAAARAGATWTHIADWPDYDDGFAVHAPVDALAPNPFGLHHVQGNLLEWCSDHYLPGYAGEFREGDAERLTDPSGLRTLRGGSYYHAALHARTSYRNPTTADKRFQYVGVRPVRALD